jgi:hypothetical protein
MLSGTLSGSSATAESVAPADDELIVLGRIRGGGAAPANGAHGASAPSTAAGPHRLALRPGRQSTWTATPAIVAASITHGIHVGSRCGWLGVLMMMLLLPWMNMVLGLLLAHSNGRRPGPAPHAMCAAVLQNPAACADGPGSPPTSMARRTDTKGSKMSHYPSAGLESSPPMRRCRRFPRRRMSAAKYILVTATAHKSTQSSAI